MRRNQPTENVNVLPGFVSPADPRYLKEVLADFGLPGIILPDISETLDGPAQADYEKIPPGALRWLTSSIRRF